MFDYIIQKCSSAHRGYELTYLPFMWQYPIGLIAFKSFYNYKNSMERGITTSAIDTLTRVDDG